MLGHLKFVVELKFLLASAALEVEGVVQKSAFLSIHLIQYYMNCFFINRQISPQSRSESHNKPQPANNPRFNRAKHSQFCGCCKQSPTDASTDPTVRGASSQRFLRVFRKKQKIEIQKNYTVRPQLKNFNQIQQHLKQLEQQSSRLLQQICSAREAPCSAESHLLSDQGSAVVYKDRQKKRRGEFQMTRLQLEQANKKIDRIITNRLNGDQAEQLQKRQAQMRRTAVRFIKSENLVIKKAKPLKICFRNPKLLIVERGYDKYIKKSKGKGISDCPQKVKIQIQKHKDKKRRSKKLTKNNQQSAQNSIEKGESLPLLKKVQSQRVRPSFGRCQVVRDFSQESSQEQPERRSRGQESQTYLSVDVRHHSSEFVLCEQIKVTKKRINKYQKQREVQTKLSMAQFLKEFICPQELLSANKQSTPCTDHSLLALQLADKFKMAKQDKLNKLKFQANWTTTVRPHRGPQGEEQFELNQFLVESQQKEKSQPTRDSNKVRWEGRAQRESGAVYQKESQIRELKKSHTFSFSEYVPQNNSVHLQSSPQKNHQPQDTPVKRVSFSSSHSDQQPLLGTVSQLSLNKCQDRYVSRFSSNLKSMVSICEDEEGYSYAPVRKLIVKLPAQSQKGLQAHRLIGQSGQSLQKNWISQICSWVTLQVCAYLGESIITRLFQNKLRLLADGSLFCYLTVFGVWKLITTKGDSLCKCLYQGLNQLRGASEWGVGQYLRSVLNSPCKSLEIGEQWQKIKKILSNLRQRSQSLIREELVFAVLKRVRNGVSLYLIQYSQKIDSGEQQQLLIRLTGQSSSFFMKSADFFTEFKSVIIINTSKDYFHDCLEISKAEETNLKVYAGGLSIRQGGNGVFSLQQKGPQFISNRISVLLYYEVEKHKYEFKGKISSGNQIFFLKFFDGGNYLFFVDGLCKDLAYAVTFSCTQKPRIKHCKWLQSSHLGFQDLELLFMPLSEEQVDKKQKSTKLRSRVRLS